MGELVSENQGEHDVSYNGVERRADPPLTESCIQKKVGNVVRRWAFVLLLAVGGQVVAVVWGASALNTTVSNVKTDVDFIKATRRTKQDAEKDFALRDYRMQILEQSINRVDSTLTTVNEMLGKISVSMAIISAEKGTKK